MLTVFQLALQLSIQDINNITGVIFIGLFLFVAIPMITASVRGAPFVPTPQPVVDKMLELAKIKKGERVIDPGCGDGRMVITAGKKYGADAIGYELFYFVYLAAKIRNLLNGSPAKIYFRDGRKADYTKADVVICYILNTTMKKYWKHIWEQKLPKGARVISYAFEIDGWKPVHIEPKIPEKNYARILVYEMGKN